MDKHLTIASSLQAQLLKVCNTVHDVIEIYPEDDWNRRKKGCLPVQQIYHIIGSIDMYCGPGNFEWEQRFKDSDGRFDWNAEIKNAPSKEEMLSYLKKMHNYVDNWLSSLSDSQILELHEQKGRHSGRCILDLFIYLLRHMQHHLGVIVSDMIRRGLKLPQWR